MAFWKVDSIRKWHFWSIFLALYVGFVFDNSLILAMESSVQSTSVLRLVTGAVKTVGLGNVGITEHFIRRTVHFSEYTLLGILLAQCLAQCGLLAVTRWQLHRLAGFLISFVNETLQLFTEGRSGQISDMWPGCAGVLFGTVLFLAVGRWHRRRKGKKNVEKKL